ncbi:antibiotic biosynthesis monooxygenase [Knoellia locipacati]|uniref:antibiotic biosynthesis monooxygenase family protein n=1 Tax=Knoellia locipacati TaxID=882824 RepID=UPI00384B4F66
MEIVLFKIRTRADIDEAEYERTFEEMVGIVSEVPGFVSIDGYAAEDGTEMAVAVFESAESLAHWRRLEEHVRTQERGREEFFEAYDITVATVSRHYSWDREGGRRPAFGEAEGPVDGSLT